MGQVCKCGRKWDKGSRESTWEFERGPKNSPRGCPFFFFSYSLYSLLSLLFLLSLLALPFLSISLNFLFRLSSFVCLDSHTDLILDT